DLPLSLLLPDKARRTTAGSAPPIYRVSNSCKAFFAHPLGVRLSYFPSLDYKPRSAFGNGLSPPLEPRLSGSKHGHSAIDVNRLPGDVGRLIRGEIDRC